MRLFNASWAASFVCFGAMAVQHAAAQESVHLDTVKRIYIDQFSVKESSNKLRDDVIAQLRKLNSITIVSNPSEADAILSGDGEVWIKCYRSLNPRSGRLPSDGTPVYAGFLSIELKDTNGDTLWSYLVTPGPVAGDMSKELSKQVEKYLAGALRGGSPAPRP